MDSRQRLVLAAVSGLVAGCRGVPPAAQEPRPVVVATDAGSVATEAVAEPVEPRRAIAVAEPEHRSVDRDCCKGKNECKGLGNCKTDAHDCAGINECKGLGGCKPAECPTTVESSMASDNCCKGMNQCKGLGNCKTSSHMCAGKNQCKGQGGCKPADCK